MNRERFNKILVVDDSTANLQLLMNLLTEQGYTVYPASDGELALEFVQSKLPDLILLDIRMPGMDGYEVCRRLQADERTRSVPIVFLSALEDEHDKVKGFQAGGVDYITKPFQPEEMLARVRIHLRMRELTEALEQEVDARTNALMITNKRLEEEIEERTKAQKALHESRQRMDNILANSPGAIYRCANDKDWTMEFISAGITRITGYAAEDFIDNRIRSYASIIHPDDRRSVADTVASSVARKDHYEVDYRLIAADDTQRWVHEQGRGVFDPEGGLLCLDGVIFDITAQRRAEEAVKLNAERMEAMLQLSQMTGASEKELMRFAYEAATRLTHSTLGYLGFMSEDESTLNVEFWSREAMDSCNVSGKPMIFPLKTAGLWGEAVRQRRPIITNDYAAANPWKKGTPEGHVKLVRHMNLPVIVNGKIVLVAGVGNKAEHYTETDVQQLTLLMEGMWRLIERLRAEEELRRYHNQLEETVRQRTEQLRFSRDEAEAANKAKSVFLANMSHELRTPLNAILGFSNIVRNDPLLPENERQNLEIINRSGEHLLTLINDVLEMAKIEAGGIELNNAPFDLGGMVLDIIDMMQMRAKEKGLQLIIDQSSQFPRYIVGDEARLRQVLINLIGNGIKYTEEGGVAVRLGTIHNERSHLLLEVEDSGPGIAAQDQPRIFEPFVQLGEHGISNGTGLGLTITRQYVQMMGGSISLESTLDKGSLFRVELPLTEATETDIAQAKQAEHGEVVGLAPGEPQYRILIVEDQRDNQALLAHLMVGVGLQTKIAENGKQGVELFQSWHPHLIFMDRRMPVMDGEEATRRIRELPGGREVKIIAVTASAFKEQRKKMLEAGLDDFVSKPFRAGEIYDCLTNQLGIRFLCEGVTEPQKLLTLTPEMLSALPEAMCNKLQEALESLESERIDQVIQQVAAHDQKLLKTLLQYTDNFDYQTILEALRKV
ncbi:MAG: response regulator [Chromatiales bacterium]|jgi:PAS domain S-box-containing protein